MKNPPILSALFLLLCGVLLVMRNIYYFKLWRCKNNFDSEEQYSKVFSSGIQKFILPILITNKVEDSLINKTIKIVNLFNYLAILSFIISGIVFFNR